MEFVRKFEKSKNLETLTLVIFKEGKKLKLIILFVYLYIWIKKKRCLLTSEWKINSQILHIELDVALEMIWK